MIDIFGRLGWALGGGVKKLVEAVSSQTSAIPGEPALLTLPMASPLGQVSPLLTDTLLCDTSISSEPKLEIVPCHVLLSGSV